MKVKTLDDYMYISLSIVFTLVAIATFIYLYFFGDISIFSCAIYDHFGIYCPGCGCTRAFLELIHLNIFKSIYYNPAVFYALAMSLLFIITQTIDRIFKFKKHIMPYTNAYLYIGIVILFLNWIVRNILLLGFNIKL